MRKFLKNGLTVFLMFCMCIGLVGCRGCQAGTNNLNKLAEIPREGNYSFLQKSNGITHGDSYVLIQEEVLKAIKKEGKKLKDEDDCKFYCEISDDGKFMWFIAEYSHESESNVGLHGKCEFAIGTITLPNLDIKIKYYIPTQTSTSFGYLGKFGDYFIIQRDVDFLAIHFTTFESKTIDWREKEYFSLYDNEFVLWKDVGISKKYRIYDKTLTEYTIWFNKSYNLRWQWGADVVEDYIFFYAYVDKGNTCVCVNYKTGERFTQEESYAMYKIYFPPEVETEQEPDFIYNGERYVWENEQYYIDKPTKDEDGKDIIQKIRYNKLVFENLETGEKRELVPLEMNGGCSLIMQKILEIYGNDLSWVQVIVEDDELFLVMVNHETFFGLATAQTSPRIVFKYDEKKLDLVYVGYALYTHYDIEHIYKM